jgi:hypothetical protein
LWEDSSYFVGKCGHVKTEYGGNKAKVLLNVECGVECGHVRESPERFPLLKIQRNTQRAKRKKMLMILKLKGGSWLHFSYESLYYQVLPSWLEHTFCLLFPKFKMKVADAEPYGWIRIWIGLSFHVNAMLQVAWKSC